MNDIIFKTYFKMRNKGVSLMALIITIIVMILLAGIALSIFSNSGTVDKATSAKILNEFIEVENAVSQRGSEHKLDSGVYPYVGTALTNATGRTVNNKLYGDGYYYLEKDDLVLLGITGSTKNYIVNYITGEVIVTDPYLIAQRQIYSKSELIDEETANTVSSIEYDEKKGVNKPTLFTGMIPVKYTGSSWVVCDVDDEEWYDYGVNSSGPVRYANVMLLDDITLKGDDNSFYSNERVRGMNLNSMVGLQVVNKGSMFIWIPRYTYKGTEVVYSRLLVDYTLNGFVKSPAFYNGTYTGASANNENDGYVAGGKELSGIWISKYEASYSE